MTVRQRIDTSFALLLGFTAGALAATAAATLHNSDALLAGQVRHSSHTLPRVHAPGWMSAECGAGERESLSMRDSTNSWCSWATPPSRGTW
jgi:hypothetical protein